MKLNWEEEETNEVQVRYIFGKGVTTVENFDISLGLVGHPEVVPKDKVPIVVDQVERVSGRYLSWCRQCGDAKPAPGE